MGVLGSVRLFYRLTRASRVAMRHCDVVADRPPILRTFERGLIAQTARYRIARIVGGPNGTSRSSSALPSFTRKLVMKPSGKPSGL